MEVNPYAGKLVEPAMLVNVPKLVTAYYIEVPDPSDKELAGEKD
jgi:phosphoglucomutase